MAMRGAEIWGFRESLILSWGIHITSLVTLLFNLGCTTIRKMCEQNMWDSVLGMPPVAFQMGSVAPWNCLCNLKIRARCIIPNVRNNSFYYERRLFFTRNNFFVSSEPPCRNPYLKAVEFMIHEKLGESLKTRWIMKNLIFYVGIKTIDSWKTWWLMKKLVNHGKLANDFLVTRNHANL